MLRAGCCAETENTCDEVLTAQKQEESQGRDTSHHVATQHTFIASAARRVECIEFIALLQLKQQIIIDSTRTVNTVPMCTVLYKCK